MEKLRVNEGVCFPWQLPQKIFFSLLFQLGLPRHDLWDFLFQISVNQHLLLGKNDMGSHGTAIAFRTIENLHFGGRVCHPWGHIKDKTKITLELNVSSMSWFSMRTKKVIDRIIESYLFLQSKIQNVGLNIIGSRWIKESYHFQQNNNDLLQTRDLGNNFINKSLKDMFWDLFISLGYEGYKGYKAVIPSSRLYIENGEFLYF